MIATNDLALQSNSPQFSEFLSPSTIVPPDTKVSSESEFAHPVWKMGSLITLPGVKNCMKSWDFRTVPGFPGGFALTLAEYAYARLYKPVATHDREGEWLTVYNELVALNQFAHVCSKFGRRNFSEADDLLYERFLHIISYSDYESERKSRDRVRTIFRFIYRLWEYGPAVSKPIPSMPFGKPLEKIFTSGRKRGEENKTSPIPEPVFVALAAAALDYVLEFSTTIIETWQKLQAVWAEEISPLDLGYDAKVKRLAKAMVVVAGKELPWRKKNWIGYGDLYDDLQQLRTACTITIVAFSGIRPSELLSIEAGCCIKDKGPDGRIMHYINTILHKHRGIGTNDTWVVIEEVVKAIEILETLTERVRVGSNDNRLMITDGTSNFFTVQKDFTGADVNEFSTAAVIAQFESFRRYCNLNLSRPPIPDWPDETGQLVRWKFNLRQFRRTLARHIARQPFGVIAGMLQYKHVEVTIFEGYAGSEPDWNKMLSEEKVLASVDILEEVAMDLSHGEVAGDFGTRLKEEFMAEFRGRAEDFPPSQIAKWLTNTKKNLFVGKFNFCFFDPTKALCTVEAAQKDKPILNFCQPEHCGNACITKRHAPMWKAQLKQAEELAEYPKASEYQRIALQEDITKLGAVVASFRNEP